MVYILVLPTIKHIHIISTQTMYSFGIFKTSSVFYEFIPMLYFQLDCIFFCSKHINNVNVIMNTLSIAHTIKSKLTDASIYLLI